MDSKNRISRRKFIDTTLKAGAVLAIPTIIPSRAFGANDRINAAVLGGNGRGNSHVKSLMALKNVEVKTLCGPDMEILGKRKKDFMKEYDRDVHLEQDLRKVYDDKDIDVVPLATPNQWHALATIWACQAGTDVCVEKPGDRKSAVE